jgi:membrane-associated phospholipid phosphatase
VTGPDVTTPDPSSPLDEGRASIKQRSLARRCRGWRPGILPALYLIGWAVLLVIFFLGLGLFVTKVGRHDVIGRADHATERWFVRERSPQMNLITHLTTDLGETLTVVAVGAVLALLARLLWHRWREPLLVVVALAGEVSIFVLLTLVIDRTRPPVPHLDAAPPTSSFPSGHTAASVVLYLLVALLISSRLPSGVARSTLWVLAVMVPIGVGLARLYRGMHYPTDVLSGAVLGASWLFVAVKGVRLGGLHADLRTDQANDGGNE